MKHRVPKHRLARPKQLNRETLERMIRYPKLREKWKDQWVYIWSGEHGAFWGPKLSGYFDKKDAGQYIFEEAFKNTNHCDSSKKIEFVIV